MKTDEEKLSIVNLFVKVNGPLMPNMLKSLLVLILKLTMRLTNKLKSCPEKHPKRPIASFPIFANAAFPKKSPIEFPPDIIIIAKNTQFMCVIKDQNEIQSKTQPEKN